MNTNQNRPVWENGGVWSKRARREHLLLTPPAWVWESAMVDAAVASRTTITEVKCHGLIYRAYGDQHGLALIYWQIRRKGKDPAAVQLALYRGR